MQVLEALAVRGKLLCPETRRPAVVKSGRLVSPAGRDLGDLAGPLNLLGAFRDSLSASEVPAAFVEKVRAHLELPSSADAEIAQAIAASGARFEEAHLSAEVRVLAERFGMPAFDLGEPAAHSEPGPVATAIGRIFSRPNAELRVEHVRDYVGERLTRGGEVWRSVRVRNAGQEPLAASGNGAVRIDTRWAFADGREIPQSGTSNELPADIEPGREITLILRVRAPAECGRFKLVIEASSGGRKAAIATLPVQSIACELPVLPHDYFPGLLEYGPDHHESALHLLDFMEKRYRGRKLTTLEIGGGVAPTGHSVAAHGNQVVSTDISHAQSILGALYFKHRMPQLSESLAFVSCDGIDLPFADDAFDGVMLFAAFHHFAEPEALLEEAKRVTGDDGFIYLGCENCVPNPADAQYREELRRGINEQMWTLEETTALVRRAGLRVARARVDFHSLKVALVKQ